MPIWLQVVLAVATIVFPIAVAWVGYLWASKQDRNSTLTEARLRHYELIAPDLNSLMCYFTFIGPWKELSPPEVIAMKRRVDQRISVAAPLFEKGLWEAYRGFLQLCFSTFQDWGTDAKLRTSAFQRRPAWRGDESWDSGWNARFEFADDVPITREDLEAIREAYDACLAAMATDIRLVKSRDIYTTREAIINAHDPYQSEIEGSG